MAEVAAHKLYGPAENKDGVQRNAILGRIFNEHSARTVLFQGPPGHGKTTLLQQARATSEELGHLSSWLTFDEADNDPGRFFLHIHALIAHVDQAARPGDPGGGRFADGQRIDSNPVDWFIKRLREIGRPVSLFFDEFQHLQEREILRFFREMMEFMPENVRIFIGSRTVPEIGFARLVANNLAFVFRTEDIRFSFEEASHFFALTGELNISREELEAIYAHTEGWPAALQLFRLVLVGPSVRHSLRNLGNFRPPELTEYLADHVLALQPPEIQDFLLRVSPLTKLSAALCEAVTGSKLSRETLLMLERSGLFVRRFDTAGNWFRMHSLFSSFLRERFQQTSPEAYTDVHRRALDWYHAQGMYEEAIHHAVAAKDHARAADVLDRWSSDLISAGQLLTVERWWQRLPFDEVRRRLDLAVKVTWAQTFLRRQQTLVSLLPVLEEGKRDPEGSGVTDPRIVRSMAAILVDDLPRSFETIRPVQVLDRNPQGFAAFELSAGANLQGYLYQVVGDFEAALKVLGYARLFSERVGAVFSLGYTHANTGMTLFLQGHLREAIDCFRGAIADPRNRLSDSIAAASLSSCYVQILYEANEIDLAETVFNEFHEIISKATLLDYLAAAYVSMVRIHDLRGRAEQARALLDEAEAIGYANSFPRLVRIVNWERVRRLLLAGDLGRAASIADGLADPSGVPPMPEGWIPFGEDAEGVAIGQIRLAVHTGQSQYALKKIAPELADARRTGRVRRQIRLGTLEAMAWAQQGEGCNAQRSLRRALKLAAQSGLVRTVLDEGEPAVRLLREHHEAAGRGRAMTAGEAALDGFVTRLLDCAGSKPDRAEEVQTFHPLEPLTRREIDILVFLGKGVSNKEMARRLFVSENTVKFHLKNAYSKLGVNSRTQAINVARKMSLL